MAADGDEGKTLRERLFGDESDEDEELGPEGLRGRSASGTGVDAYTARKQHTAASEDDEEGVPLAEDRDFIDDTHAEPESEPDSDGEGVERTPAEEAEEDNGDGDEFDRIQKEAKDKRKRKRHDDEEVLQQEIDHFLARMEVAWENDVQANQEKRPAVHKLKLTREMTDVLGQAHLQRKFLDHKDGLTLLTRWLEPLPDGSLPNINIRTAILKLLLQMPIHVEEDEGRAQLKNSRIGRVVMFLSKLPEETAANRRMAKDLVNRWSRPIFLLESKHTHGISDDSNRQDPQQIMDANRDADAEQLDEDGNPIQRKGPAPGERGWRWHASIPQTSKLDYKVRPVPKFSKEAMTQRSDSKSKHEKLDRKIKGMKIKNKKTGADGPVKISVEGRGLLH